MKLFLLFICFSLSSNLFADEIFKFRLIVNGSENEHIKKVQIDVAGESKIYDVSQSELIMAVNKSPIYQIALSAEGYYPSIQTFSHHELFGPIQTMNPQTMNDQQKTAHIPAIKLVKKKANRVMMAFGGDVMMGRRYNKPYFNEPVLISDNKAQQTKNILKHIKPYMEIADFSAVNLESQVSKEKPSQRAPKSVTFFSPPETIDALKWAGIDYVTLGNNHIYDYVDEGLKSTLAYLNEKKLPYSGAGLNQQEALKPYLWKHQDLNYDMLGFVGWAGGFTPNQVAEENKGGSAFGTMKNIVSTVKESVSKNHGTVVQYHGSLEYSDEPTGVTESRLKSAIDHGADLVIAHHPHVTQGMELYKNKLIAYSMGNFVFDQYFYATPHSYILYVWMDGEAFHRAEIVPIYLKGYQPTPAVGQQRSYVSNRTRHLSSKRQLQLAQTGGHLEINISPARMEPVEEELFIQDQQKTISMVSFPSKGPITEIITSNDSPYKLGVNQFNNGDFESFTFFSNHERGWHIENFAFQDQNNNFLKAEIVADSSAQVGMKNFRRVFKASSQMSFNVLIQNSKPVNLELFLQLRKTRDKFFDAINSPMKLLKSVHLPATGQPEVIGIDFNLPRVGYRSYRVMLKITNQNNETSVVTVDDLELIQWQGHYTASRTLPHSLELLTTATHIGLQNNKSKQTSVKIKHER